MIFLLDANIPPSLQEDILEHQVIHVQSFTKGTATKDKEINDFSFENECLLITKDTDFYDSFLLIGKPPKLILVKLGNVRIRELRSYFRKNWKLIEELIQTHPLLILTKDSIKVTA